MKEATERFDREVLPFSIDWQIRIIRKTDSKYENILEELLFGDSDTEFKP